jgi:uracil phosphoribosyltransferase
MEGVTIVSHPLVQHKLTLLRRKDTSTKSFRELLREIGMFLLRGDPRSAARRVDIE